MRVARTGTLIAAVALAGCGLLPSAPCDKADDAVKKLEETTASCANLTSVPTISTKSECETAVKGCSDTEKTVISEEMDCLTKLSACVSGQEKAWSQSAAMCIAPTAALSSACKKAFGLPL